MRPTLQFAVPEFQRWFDKRLARKARAVRRLERLRRRAFWQRALVIAVSVLFGALSIAGFASELVGAYWGPFGR